jgi:hypothetical protein
MVKLIHAEPTRDSVESWIKAAALSQPDFLFPGRIHASPHLSTRASLDQIDRLCGTAQGRTRSVEQKRP